MNHEDRNAHHAMAKRVSVGCSGDCADSGECPCSHAPAWRAPRQPRRPEPIKPFLQRMRLRRACSDVLRRPEPRKPHLPLWTRLKLGQVLWQAAAVVLGVIMGCAFVAGCVLVWWRL